MVKDSAYPYKELQEIVTRFAENFEVHYREICPDGWQNSCNYSLLNKSHEAFYREDYLTHFDDFRKSPRCMDFQFADEPESSDERRAIFATRKRSYDDFKANVIMPFIPEKEEILAVYLFAIATVLDLDLSEDPHSRIEFSNIPILMERQYIEKACAILEIDDEEFDEFLEYVTYAGIERLDLKVHNLSPFYTIFFRQLKAMGLKWEYTSAKIFALNRIMFINPKEGRDFYGHLFSYVGALKGSTFNLEQFLRAIRDREPSLQVRVYQKVFGALPENYPFGV